MTKRGWMIPREHGAWMMLYAPFVIGVVRGGAWTLDVVWMCLFITGGYCVREPLTVWFARKNRRKSAVRWLAGCLVVAGAGAFALLRHERIRELAALATVGGAVFLVHLALARRREHRGFVGELIGVAGLTLTAPLGYFAVSGNDRQTALLLWFLNLLYFGSSILYVKWRVARLSAERRREHSRTAVGSLALYHAALIGALVALYSFEIVSGWAFAAFAPLALRYALRPLVRKAPTLIQVGVSEMVLSFMFTAIMCRGV